MTLDGLVLDKTVVAGHYCATIDHYRTRSDRERETRNKNFMKRLEGHESSNNAELITQWRKLILAPASPYFTFETARQVLRYVGAPMTTDLIRLGYKLMGHEGAEGTPSLLRTRKMLLHAHDGYVMAYHIHGVWRLVRSTESREANPWSERSRADCQQATSVAASTPASLKLA